MSAKHTPGPWEACGNLIEGPGGEEIAQVTEYQVLTPRQWANAQLIKDAPAMEIALDLLSFGLARIERSGRLVEFCFGGIRYVLNDDWDATITVVGWDKARAAIAIAAKAEGVQA